MQYSNKTPQYRNVDTPGLYVYNNIAVLNSADVYSSLITDMSFVEHIA
jgi:hypothetical protein